MFIAWPVKPDSSSPEMAHLHRPRWLVPLVALGLAALLVGACYVIPPAYEAYKHSRAEAAARKAADAMERQDWKTASENVRLAIALAPENANALRQAARYMSIGNLPNAFQYWQMFFDHGSPTRQDRLMFVALTLRMRRTDWARPHLIQLLTEDSHDAEALELCLALLIQEGRTKQASVAARHLAGQFPDRPGTELRLARSLLAAGERGNKSEARHLLWQLAFRPKPEAFVAIEELSRFPELSNSELRLLLRRVPETQTNALLRMIVENNLRFRLEPKADREAAALAIRGYFRGAVPVEDRIRAVDWLLANAPATNALDLVSIPFAQTNALVLQRRLQALANLDRWTDIAAHVEDEKAPITPVMRDIYRAIVATHTQKADEAATHLASAVDRNDDNPETLQLIAAYAETMDQPRIAADALQRLLGNPTLAPTTGSRVIGLLSRVDDIPPMLQALDRLLVYDPTNDSLRNGQAWLRLLTGERIEESQQAAEQIVRQHPDEPRYLATLALGFHRLGQPERAFELLESRNLGATNAPVRARLVHCAAMGATGRRDAARRLARQIPMEGLRSEERLMIQEWIEAPKAP